MALDQEVSAPGAVPRCRKWLDLTLRMANRAVPPTFCCPEELSCLVPTRVLRPKLLLSVE